MRQDGSNDMQLPPQFQWWIGLTSASIDFVNSAQAEIQKLEQAIKDIKSKKVSLAGNLPVEQYLQTGWNEANIEYRLSS